MALLGWLERFISYPITTVFYFNGILGNMKSEDLTKAPKLFCESINVGFTPEYFVMGLSSGAQGAIYSLTPQHTKRLQQYLTHQIAEYEKQHGEIKAEWNPNIVSPVQRMNPPTELS
jgi:hypothetical protein